MATFNLPPGFSCQTFKFSALLTLRMLQMPENTGCSILKNQTINILPLRENGMNYEMSLSTYTVVSIVIQQFSSYVSEN